ncbi:hypothetical protein RGUI_1018 [Rhodovulum sp. P5]|uniref:DUF2059 domain-containing protein n=1 Tax=Rhodovulum sp. P5 TaxID=1564506 RepID=UPI0009C3006E|nr:DUF2059 domain-containing protein [Rhodovulum sp. P5]ARE39159.1 hypothetical protein RGUI_1018 [Rhodovulum sp. P5]
MKRLSVLPVLLVLFLLSPVRVFAAPQVDALLQAMAFDELVEIVHEEGLGYGATIEEELFPGRGGALWKEAVARAYDTDRMVRILRGSLAAELDARDLDTLTGFFRSDTGARIIRLELSARRALLLPDVEAASRARLEAMQSNGNPRLALLDRFEAANGLVEANVVSALNANFAFYTGLSRGGAFDGDFTEEDMLIDVASQAPEIRDEMQTWLFAYLAMAYDPLPDSALESYIALSQTDAGQALNTALFAGFDLVFTDISRELGMAAALFLAGEDI